MRIFGELSFGRTPGGAFIPFDSINPQPEIVNNSVILVELSATGGELISTNGPFRAFGSLGAIGFSGKISGGTEKKLYWSDKDWTSGQLDTLPNTRFEGRLESFSVERGLPIRPDGERRVVPTLGDLTIINADGQFDNIHNQLSIQGQSIIVRLLEHEYSSYDDSKVLVSGVGEDWTASSEKLNISFLSQAYKLDTALLSFYAGNGGWGGDVGLEGRPVAQIFGHCKGMQPELIDAAKFIYQVHSREIKNILAVYEGGDARVRGTKRASFLALQNNNPTPGTWDWVSTPEGSAFRLGSTPGNPISCDVEGDAPGGLYVATTSGIAKRLIEERQVPLDTASFVSIEARFPGIVGVWFNNSISVIDAVSELCRGGEFYWGDLGTGTLALGKLSPPNENAQNVVALNENFFLSDIEPLASPRPVWRVKVGYGRNWFPLNDSEILPFPTVPEAQRKLLQEPESQVIVSDLARKRKFPNAEDIIISSFYLNKNDAEALGLSILARLRPDQGLWRVTVGLIGYGLKLGQQLRVDWTRHGLMLKTVRLVGHQYRGPEVDLLVMG